jgi:Ca-activated chloride channel family protein
VPLSDDLLTSRNLLEALKPSIMPEPGQRADLGVDKARQLLQQGANGKGRILLITSQLTAAELRAISRSLDDSAIQLDVLGIGTPEGAPITQQDGSFLKDESGGILMPRLEESSLQKAAQENAGRYSRIRLDNQDLDHLQLLDSAQSTRQTTEPTRLQLWADAGHWLLLPLLLLVACAGRRGWLLCLPLLLVMPRPVYAFEFMDLWLTPDQQGARLLQKNQPAAAAERFADPQWQGISLYEAGDYAEAAGRFNQGDRAIDHYNRGNALARNGDLEAAVDAYDTALERQPDLTPALQNKALVEDLLRQQKEQQEQQNPADAQPGEQDQQPSDGQSGQNQQGKDPQQTQDESTGKPADRKPASDPQQGQQGQQPEQTDSPTQDTQGASGKPEQSPAGDPADGSSKQASGAANEPLSENPKTPASPNGKSAEDQTPAGTDTNASQPGESAEPLNEENRQALEQWLRQIPDDPAELLRRKFWYEQQQRQENLP